MRDLGHPHSFGLRFLMRICFVIFWLVCGRFFFLGIGVFFGEKGGQGFVVVDTADGVEAAGGAGFYGVFGGDGGLAQEEIGGQAFDERAPVFELLQG